jgi:hypothetical protein
MEKSSKCPLLVILHKFHIRPILRYALINKIQNRESVHLAKRKKMKGTTSFPAEVGKVTLKSNGDEALSD